MAKEYPMTHAKRVYSDQHFGFEADLDFVFRHLSFLYHHHPQDMSSMMFLSPRNRRMSRISGV